ncbi:hypothetical protein M0805_005917 [Coniferiporia weirii]|nr:hypothetical protein M0805_005917 [Coniferiporia weirii]
MYSPLSFILIARVLLLTSYETGDDRLSILDEREAKLTQDSKEISALFKGVQRLLQRFDEQGTRLLDWFPNALRHLLQSRIVGPTFDNSASSNAAAGPNKTSPSDLDRERGAVLHVLVMLEILDWVAEVLVNADAKANRGGKKTLPEAARKRIVQSELIRISVSSEDLRDVLEQEVRDLRAYRERLKASKNAALLSPPISLSAGDVTGTYAHPLFDRSIPATDARPPSGPGPSWMHRVLMPSVLRRSRQRAHSFPIALGLLTRCVIKGTITPSRLRTRAKSLDDPLPLH